MPACAFCGRSESEVGRMFAGGGRGGLPAVHICGACAAHCAELLGDAPPPAPSSDEVGARILVHWTPFVVEDRPLEWAAAKVDIEGSPAILVSVRRPGRDDSGVGVIYPDTTEPTVERARETAKSF